MAIFTLIKYVFRWIYESLVSWYVYRRMVRQLELTTLDKEEISILSAMLEVLK